MKHSKALKFDKHRGRMTEQTNHHQVRPIGPAKWNTTDDNTVLPNIYHGQE